MTVTVTVWDPEVLRDGLLVANAMGSASVDGKPVTVWVQRGLTRSAIERALRREGWDEVAWRRWEREGRMLRVTPCGEGWRVSGLGEDVLGILGAVDK